MFNCKFFAKIYKSFELEWQRMVFNVATFKCKIIAKKQAKRQKNTKLVQNKAKGAKIFLTVYPKIDFKAKSKLLPITSWPLKIGLF